MWHHFTHVWDGSVHYLYYDGALYSKGTDSNGALSTIGNGCVFGSRDTRFLFRGDIKGMRVFKEALSVDQIEALYSKDGRGVLNCMAAGQNYSVNVRLCSGTKSPQL
jgi:hypothetical protein